MKYIIVIFAILASVAFAQEENFINGSLNIAFDTRTQLDGTSPKRGVTDKYKIRVNVSNSVIFDGLIEHLPRVSSTFSTQNASLTHAIECLVVNPRNPSQTRNIGRLYGTVPIDAQNVYRFEDGNLRIGIFGAAGTQGFESRVRGVAIGKQPQTSGLVDRFKKEALTISRSVRGNSLALAVTNYDRMEFVAHTLSAGPVPIYPEVTVNGQMIYDYDRTAWYLNGLTASYPQNGRQMQDRLSGNIRWVENKAGVGHYEFDIRINEPLGTEASHFSGPVDEASFFETDSGVAGLTGTMTYKDSMVDDTVVNSAVTIDLKGNHISKEQTMYLAKLLLMSSIIPLNSE